MSKKRNNTKVKKETKITPQDILLNLIPEDGSTKGNVTLLKEFNKKVTSGEDYWDVRNSLIVEGKLGKARGKGGSVYRLNPSNNKSKVNLKNASKTNERDLYNPFSKTLQDFWAKDNDLKNFILQITAFGGSKKTGKWTRPDITIINVKSFPYYINKIQEIISFEIKPNSGYGIESVYETAAHTLFSNKSYLAIHYLEDAYENDERIDLIRSKCEMFGVGLILFKDPGDWSTLSVVIEARHNNPDPSEVNQFITQQINQDNKHALLEKFK